MPLGAVDKIEANLKQLVDQEATARTEELAKLRVELKSVKGQTSSPAVSPKLAELTLAVKMLSMQVAALEDAGQATGDNSNNEIAGLIAEIEMLRSELYNVKQIRASLGEFDQ